MGPFRFNQKDLQVLATQSSEQFHKEGLLWFKEKERKNLKKSEVFGERFFRLYGNLLFYFKGKDQSSECSGVIVLEDFQLVPDKSSSKSYSFNIEFEKGEEQKYEFAAACEEDYNTWTSVISASSYSGQRNYLEDLRKQIVAITGQDPLPDQVSLGDFFESQQQPMDMSSHEEVLMEMCLSCRGLQSSDGQTISSSMVKICTVIPPETEWSSHSNTEICEDGPNPNFLRTIILSKKHTSVTRLRFAVYNVLNKTKHDVAVIGQSVCTIQEVQNAKSWHLCLSIKNFETTVGTMVIQGWERETGNPFLAGNPFFDRRMTISRVPAQENSVRSYVTNIIQRSFHVPTRDGHDLKFQEFLAESQLCFKIPRMLVGLFMAEEKENVMELHNMGQLHPEWNKIQELALNSHFDLVHQYSSSLADICQHEDIKPMSAAGKLFRLERTNIYYFKRHQNMIFKRVVEDRCFKKSVEKGDKKFEFVPTNMHIHRECVIEKNNQEYYYDVITVGAPTAFCLKYKHGGLRKMIKASEENPRKSSFISSDEKTRSRYKKAASLRDVLKLSKEEIIDTIKACKQSVEKENHLLLSEITASMSSKIAELINYHHHSSFVRKADELLLKARTIGPSLRMDRVNTATDIDDPEYKDLEWEWTGSDFKATRTPVSTEKDCGVALAFSEFTTAVNVAVTTETFENRNDILVKLLSLEKCIDSSVRKINVLMRFLLMQEDNYIVGMKDIRYRKDVVFSQALTPVVAGFSLMLSQRCRDTFFLNQLAQVGLLVHFESLLTTHGDEMGMLEDMIVGVQMLSTVSFKLISSDTENIPIVRGKRSKVVVEFPVKSKLFKTLPEKLKEQNIIIRPILFTVGINEQATLAEKIGDTSLQEHVNSENFYLLEEYFKAFFNYAPDHVGTASSNPVPFTSLLEQLKTTINARKYKDVEIFTLSEELCWRMNALRLTCCKSAKDRSSMAVTLEMVRSLMREHNLKENVFMNVLNGLRSQGTRLINAQKNVGIPKYAFNMVQVRALPNLYKPPEGTTGKSLQT